MKLYWTDSREMREERISKPVYINKTIRPERQRGKMLERTNKQSPRNLQENIKSANIHMTESQKNMKKRLAQKNYLKK